MNKTDSFCPFITVITQPHNLLPPSFLHLAAACTLQYKHRPGPQRGILWLSLSSATLWGPCVVLMIISIMDSGWAAPHDSLLLFCCLPVFHLTQPLQRFCGLSAFQLPYAWISSFEQAGFFILLEVLSLCPLHLRIIYFLFLALIATRISAFLEPVVWLEVFQGHYRFLWSYF